MRSMMGVVQSAMKAATLLSLVAASVIVGSASVRAAGCPYPAERWREARLIPNNQSVPDVGRSEHVPGVGETEEGTVIWTPELRLARTNFRDIPDGGPLRALARPVGRLEHHVILRNGQPCISPCTATLISPEYLLTNQHCVGSWAFRDVVRVGVRFGYVSDTEPGEFFEVDPDPLEEQGGSLDYAILRVHGNPAARYGTVTLQAKDLAPWQPLVLIGYPAGFRQQIVRNECEAAGRGPIIDGKLLHQCHSVGGNSGSPLFDASTGAMVALHFAGGLDTRGGFNQAVPVSAIAAASPIIGRLLGGGPPRGVTMVVGVWPQVGSVFRDCADCSEMVILPRGSFMMGSPDNEERRYSDEGPQHPVTIDYDLAVGRYEVTFSEWDACVAGGGCGGYRPNDRGWGRGRRPVIIVSWEDAQGYVQWLSRKTGQRYRLLSEAEWEYAARAGTTTPFHTGRTITTDQANFDGNHTYGGSSKGVYRRQTVGVGSFSPNAFGLFDIHGNVWEWVEDCYRDSYSSVPTDGRAVATGSCETRVLRGGSWVSGPWRVRSALRYGSTAGVRLDFNGFRLARTLNP